MWSETLSGSATFLYTHPVRGTLCARATEPQNQSGCKRPQRSPSPTSGRIPRGGSTAPHHGTGKAKSLGLQALVSETPAEIPPHHGLTLRRALMLAANTAPKPSLAPRAVPGRRRRPGPGGTRECRSRCQPRPRCQPGHCRGNPAPAPGPCPAPTLSCPSSRRKGSSPSPPPAAIGLGSASSCSGDRAQACGERVSGGTASPKLWLLRGH